MKNEEIMLLLNKGQLIKKSVDRFRAESLLKAAIINSEFAKRQQIDEETATGVFREMYEAFRQLGDAKWWMMGYEPIDSHKVSMKILMSANISKNYKLQSIDRFRVIRNDANYRGELVKKEQALEIVSLWDEVSKELIEWVKK